MIVIDQPFSPLERPTLDALYDPVLEAACRGMGRASFADTVTRAASVDLGPRWQIESGGWEIKANGFFECDGANGRIRVLGTNGRSLRQFNGSSSLKVTKSAAGRSPGPVFRAVDDQNRLMVRFSDTAVFLEKRDAGTETDLQSWALAYTSPQAVVIEAVYQNDEITVRVQGETLGTYTLTEGDATKFGTASSPVADGVGITWGSGGLTADDFVTAGEGVTASMMLPRMTDHGPGARHLEQANAQRQIRLFDDGTRFVFAGDGANDIMLLSGTDPFSTASRGHVLAAVPYLKTVTGTKAYFSSGNESGTTRFIEWCIDGTALKVIQRNNDTRDEVAGDSVLAVRTPYLVDWASTGSEWSEGVNGSTEALSVVSGSNSGDWLASVTNRGNVAALGRKVSSEDHNAKYMGSLIVFSEPLHEIDRRLTLRWMEQQGAYGVGIEA